MNVADAVAFAGHEVHVCRRREAGTLLRWLGQDLRGLRARAAQYPSPPATSSTRSPRRSSPSQRSSVCPSR